jgi:hypothetical protein
MTFAVHIMLFEANNLPSCCYFYYIVFQVVVHTVSAYIHVIFDLT